VVEWELREVWEDDVSLWVYGDREGYEFCARAVCEMRKIPDHVRM
jgi:hypothetical protein